MKIKPNKVKKGKWRKEKTLSGSLLDLPYNVIEHCRKIQSEKNVDWTVFKGSDGNLWVVSKHFEEEALYTVVAAIVKYESNLIVQE